MEQSIFQEKKLTKAILILVFPAMLGQLTTLVYNVADTYFVSLTNDPDQIAAVTLCTPVLLIIMSVGSIFGAGGNSLVARLLGSRHEQEAGKVISYCIYTVFICSIAVTLLTFIFLSMLVKLIGADTDNASFTGDYLRYVLFGVPFIMFSNAMVHIFRSAGLIKQATIGLMMGNIINIVLDFVFVVFFHLGTVGVAVATSIGFASNTLYYLVCIYQEAKKGNPMLSLSPKRYQPTLRMTGQVLSIGIPGALITIMMSFANIVLNNYIAIYGSGAVAAYGIAVKINTVAVMLSVGLSQGVAPLIGYSYGAKEYGRMKRAMKLSMIYSIVLGLFFTFIFIILREFLVGFFLNEEQLIEQAGLFLGTLCISNGITGIINLVTSYYQSCGKALPSLLITICKNVIIFIPTVILFNSLFGLTGIVAAQPFVEYMICAVCFIMYLVSVRKLGSKEVIKNGTPCPE